MQLLTIREAAKRFALSTRAVYELLDKGTLKKYRLRPGGSRCRL